MLRTFQDVIHQSCFSGAEKTGDYGHRRLLLLLLLFAVVVVVVVVVVIGGGGGVVFVTAAHFLLVLFFLLLLRRRRRRRAVALSCVSMRVVSNCFITKMCAPCVLILFFIFLSLMLSHIRILLFESLVISLYSL